MKSIGEIYFDRSYFTDPASKTIGEPIIGEKAFEILSNRRNAKGRLNSDGQVYLSKIIQELKHIFPDNEIKVVWDKYCGCSMCPCSPGYRVKIDRDVRSITKYRFSLWIDENGNYQFRPPEYYFDIGLQNVEKLKNTFK